MVLNEEKLGPKEASAKEGLDKEKEKKQQSVGPPSFSTLVHSIASSALMAMGLVPEMKEKTNKALAEFNIDLLVLLKEKTKGNLQEEEARLMDSLIQDLQISYATHMNSTKP